MPIELVIWDYNGTLTDDLPRVSRAVNLFLGECGVSPATNEEVACYDGDIWRFYRERNINLPKAEIGSRVFDIYSRLTDPLYLMPGAIETLEKIDKPQVLVTKHPTHLTEREVDELGIRSYFSQIHSGIRDKTPLFQQLCQERNIAPSVGVVIGDRIEDIKEGKLAGNKVIAIPGYHPRHILEQHNPDYIIESLLEVYECIRN
ncbi:MAG: HAD family hydrolase [Nanoarchaeota archaeon]|nr:HAD family hydrolase [Nanoarchaeota archaeon]